MKLDTPILRAIWQSLGFPKGWGSYQPDIGDAVHFVIPLPNGIPAEALVAERVGSPGYVAYISQAAVAAQFSYVRLSNIAGSGQKLLIDQIYQLTTNDSLIKTGLPAGGAGGALTSKQIGGAAPAAAATFLGSSAAPGGTVIGQLPLTGLHTFSDPFQLDPGTDLWLQSVVVNVNLTTAWFFRSLPI